MRVTSQFWVEAYIRRAYAAGAFAVVARKGAVEAGAIYIRVERSPDHVYLYGPAPPAFQAQHDPSERRWQAVFNDQPKTGHDVDERLQREQGFDPDLWVIAVEDREGHHFLGDLLLTDKSLGH